MKDFLTFAQQNDLRGIYFHWCLVNFLGILRVLKGFSQFYEPCDMKEVSLSYRCLHGAFGIFRVVKGLAFLVLSVSCLNPDGLFSILRVDKGLS